MNRRKALLRMGRIMMAGIFLPLISWFFFTDTMWIFLAIFLYGVWIWIFGGYINRMLNRIDRDYPKEEENSN